MVRRDDDDDGTGATQRRPALSPRDRATEKMQPLDPDLTPPAGVEPATRRISRAELAAAARPRDDQAPGGFDPTAIRASRPPADDAPGGFDPTAIRRSSSEPSHAGRVPEAPVLDATSVRSITSDSDPLIGAMLGEYRVLAPLGSGGMGVVYRGVQPVIDRPVAIKVMRSEFAQDPAHVRRFLQEARLVSVARHPGIVDVFSFGETPGGQPYLVMELLEGEALDELLKRGGALPPKEAIALLVPMLNALSAAHAAGVIHRDLKPANVFIVKLQDGTTFPKLLDFGLAKRGDGGAAWVRQTSVGGTPLYIAPEQARGEDISPRTDLYSLGCVAYELLTGTPPFTAVNLSELLDHHQTLAPRPLRPRVQVPPELERVVLSLLEKDPARRPPSALAVREELERVAQKLTAPPEPAARRRAAPPRRKAPTQDNPPVAVAPVTAVETPVLRERKVWPFVVGGLLLVALGAGLALLLTPRPPPPAPALPRPAPVVAAAPPAPPRIEPAPSEPEPAPTLAPAPPAVPPSPPEPEPEPEPEATPRPRAPRHTAAQATKRLRQLERRVQQHPDESVRRAAHHLLEELSPTCAAKPDACWRELDALERSVLR